jgi:intracellular multiplication protein IcmJ
MTQAQTQTRLRLSTKSILWGESRVSVMEPEAPEVATEFLLTKALSNSAQTGPGCMFCGLESTGNEVHNLNDNHRDVQTHNLRVVDALCHHWQHLGELGPGQGVIVYLPHLAARDVAHLLRTILVGLVADDVRLKADAKALLNWLASHEEYVEHAFGSSDPAAFAGALQRTAQTEQGLPMSMRDAVFEGLALIVNPDRLTQAARTWRSELGDRCAPAQWRKVYRDVMNAPS